MLENSVQLQASVNDEGDPISDVSISAIYYDLVRFSIPNPVQYTAVSTNPLKLLTTTCFTSREVGCLIWLGCVDPLCHQTEYV